MCSEWRHRTDGKQKKDCLHASKEKTRGGNFDLQVQTGEKEIAVHGQKTRGGKFDLQVRTGEKEIVVFAQTKKGNICLLEHSKTDKWGSICLQRVDSNSARNTCDGAE